MKRPKIEQEYHEQGKLEKIGGMTVMRCCCGRNFTRSTGVVKSFVNRGKFLYFYTKERNIDEIKKYAKSNKAKKKKLLSRFEG